MELLEEHLVEQLMQESTTRSLAVGHLKLTSMSVKLRGLDDSAAGGLFQEQWWTICGGASALLLVLLFPVMELALQPRATQQRQSVSRSELVSRQGVLSAATDKPRVLMAGASRAQGGVSAPERAPCCVSAKTSEEGQVSAQVKLPDEYQEQLIAPNKEQHAFVMNEDGKLLQVADRMRDDLTVAGAHALEQMLLRTPPGPVWPTAIPATMVSPSSSKSGQSSPSSALFASPSQLWGSTACSAGQLYNNSPGQCHRLSASPHRMS